MDSKRLEEIVIKRYGDKTVFSHTQAACFRAGARWMEQNSATETKQFLLENLRNITTALETMDLKDPNRKTVLEKKRAIQTVLQMLGENSKQQLFSEEQILKAGEEGEINMIDVKWLIEILKR